MFIESQKQYMCIVNTNNIKGITESRSNTVYGLYADDYKLCEYRSVERCDEVFKKLIEILKENTKSYYKIPEE